METPFVLFAAMTVPSSLFKLPRIRRIDLGDCDLTGSIPDTAELVSLTELDLARNNLDGDLPISLLKSSPNYMYLSRNSKLTLPTSELSSLVGVDIFDISNIGLGGKSG